ncbi:hypothetical protein N658DRAFT_270134 [Parathielavia hyrcaniae]|uniref:Uncharacterized protein n=1 Tax=Parathielavia hyrcaniae TaxID=113614 RepID=A0AAN6PVS4_9PEZI|nr:hypothetical protein N658DRAFT_270134 [Parathielavia hyrcaniae]
MARRSETREQSPRTPSSELAQRRQPAGRGVEHPPIAPGTQNCVRLRMLYYPWWAMDPQLARDWARLIDPAYADKTPSDRPCLPGGRALSLFFGVSSESSPGRQQTPHPDITRTDERWMDREVSHHPWLGKDTGACQDAWRQGRDGLGVLVIARLQDSAPGSGPEGRFVSLGSSRKCCPLRDLPSTRFGGTPRNPGSPQERRGGQGKPIWSPHVAATNGGTTGEAFGQMEVETSS